MLLCIVSQELKAQSGNSSIYYDIEITNGAKNITSSEIRNSALKIIKKQLPDNFEQSYDSGADYTLKLRITIGPVSPSTGGGSDGLHYQVTGWLKNDSNGVKLKSSANSEGKASDAYSVTNQVESLSTQIVKGLADQL